MNNGVHEVNTKDLVNDIGCRALLYSTFFSFVGLITCLRCVYNIFLSQVELEETTSLATKPYIQKSFLTGPEMKRLKHLDLGKANL